MIRFSSHVIEVGKLFPKADKKQKFVKVSQLGIGLSLTLGNLEKAIEELASKLHEKWAEGMRANLKAKGEPLERFRDDGEGGQIDILNTPYSELTPKWQAENKAQAESAIKLVSQNMDSAMDNIEELAAQVHEQWRSRNSSWAKNGPLDVPYSELPEEEQKKDKDVITVAYDVLSKMMPSQNLSTPAEDEGVQDFEKPDSNI